MSRHRILFAFILSVCCSFVGIIEAIPSCAVRANSVNYNTLYKVRDDFRFLDVPLTPVMRDDIVWVYQYGIANGYTASTYKPSNRVSRGQMAIYLYSVAGRPDFTPGANPFHDINPNTVGYREILWLIQNGMTSGVSPGKYSPDTGVTRNQMAIFLFRLSGQSYDTENCGFSDVYKLPSLTKKAICYLKDKGVTGGTSPGVFSPFAVTTRIQMSTFIHRTAQNILNNINFQASEPDILLGAFFQNESNPYNVYLYTSVDGVNFTDPPSVSAENGQALQSDSASGYKIFTPSQEQMLKSILQKSNNSQNSLADANSLTANPTANLRDPTITYYNGYFWIFGTYNEIKNKTGFWLAYSKDLRTFSDPQQINNINVPSSVYRKSDGTINSWAPSPYVEGSNVNVVISAGNADTYMEQIITSCTFTPNNDNEKLNPATVNCADAQKINIPGATVSNSSSCDISKNYRGKIDGQIRKYGLTYYLTDKPNGHCPNEMFSSSNLNGPYYRVNNNISDSNKYGTHKNNGSDIYKMLEGTNTIYYRDKFFSYPDNFWPEGGAYNGDVQYIISGSERFTADTRPVKLTAPRKVRHGQVENFKNEDAKNAIWKLRNGITAANWDLYMTVQQKTSRPDNKFIQGQTGFSQIYITNKGSQSYTKSLKYWDNRGNTQIIENLNIGKGETKLIEVGVTPQVTGVFIGAVCYLNASSVCDGGQQSTFTGSTIADSSQKAGTLGAVWADKTGSKTIRVTIAHPETDGGWPIIQYKVELERLKKSTLVQYVSAGAEYAWFNNLKSGTYYWVKLTAITGFGSSPRHVRSCGYGSAANCNTGIKI